jgi:hypothetical protein
MPLVYGSSHMFDAIAPEFITESYDTPCEGPYYTTDRSTAFFNMPFCHACRQYEDEIDYADVEAPYNKLRDIDDDLDSSEFRLQMLGEQNADKSEYQPIVLTIVDIEDTENYFRPPHTKFSSRSAIQKDNQNGGYVELKTEALQHKDI